jgi:hypothetical protein
LSRLVLGFACAAISFRRPCWYVITELHSLNLQVSRHCYTLIPLTGTFWLFVPVSILQSYHYKLHNQRNPIILCVIQ